MTVCCLVVVVVWCGLVFRVVIGLILVFIDLGIGVGEGFGVGAVLVLVSVLALVLVTVLVFVLGSVKFNLIVRVSDTVVFFVL